MKKLIYTFAIAAMLSAGVNTRAFGQAPYIVDDGDEVPCTLVCEGFVEVFAVDIDGDGLPDQTSGFGTGTASFVGVGSIASPATGIFQASGMSLTGNSPEFGRLAFAFDLSRPAPNTTVTEILVGSIFPARVDVYANVIGTVASIPGTFINRNVCHMTATVNSFNPQVNEAYSFSSDVEFIDANGGPNAPTAFRIPAGTAVWMN